MALAYTMLRSFSQVFFQNNPFFGGLIILGLVMTAPIGLFFALLGNITSYITALILKFPKDVIETGAYGLNGVLIGSALSVYIKSIPLAVGLTITGTIIATILYSIILKNHFNPFAIPFVLVVGMILLIFRISTS